jgi:hypothetical protein
MDPPLRISTPKPKKENSEYSEEDYEEHYDYKTDYRSMSKTSTSVETIIHTNPASEMSPLELNPKDSTELTHSKDSTHTIINTIPINQDNPADQDIPVKPSSKCCCQCDCIKVYFNNLCYKFYIFCLELD